MTSYLIEIRRAINDWTEVGGADRLEHAVQGAIAYWGASKSGVTVRVRNRTRDEAVFELMGRLHDR